MPSQQHTAWPTEHESMETEPKFSYWRLPSKQQLVVLIVARICDPMAMSSIQSYMFYQLKFFNPSASNAKVSTQAGILVGARTAAQVLTGMIWGRLADSELGGRKVVLFVGLISCAVAYVGYGLARTFTAAILWQVFAGFMSNNVAITRCVVAELYPEKRHRTRALLLLPLSGACAQLIGPLIGGLLSSNTQISKGSEHLDFYPFLGPNLFLAILYMVAGMTVLFFLDETLESLQGSQHQPLRRLTIKIKQQFQRSCSADNQPGDLEPLLQSPNSYQSCDRSTPSMETAALLSKSPLPAPRPKKKLSFLKIWTPNVLATLLTRFIIGGHLGTFATLYSIYLTTPIQMQPRKLPFEFAGGLGLLPRDVGIALSLVGAIGMALQLWVYPILQDAWGTVKVWRISLLLFPAVYVLAPYPSFVASAPGFDGQKGWTWTAMCGVLLLYTIGRTGVVPATTLLINDCTPHPSVRGTIHTTAAALGQLARSIFPVVTLSVFGVGEKIGVVGLGFWCLAVLAVLSCIASTWVKEGSNGREIKLEDDDEE